MKFRVIRQPAPSGAHSPIYVVEQETGQGVGWINRYLDREYIRRLAYKSLYSCAHSLLHFVRRRRSYSQHERLTRCPVQKLKPISGRSQFNHYPVKDGA